MDYDSYLQSEKWDKTRRRVKAFWNNRCAICGTGHNVEVHHRSYRHLGNEPLSDLIALCGECHELYHANLNRTNGTEHISEVLQRVEYKVRCNNG
jgi:5-methylcytosine-specific restriction endonuclease McrA